MNSHRHSAETLERRRVKKARRKEVRDICHEIVTKRITDDADDYFVSHTHWEYNTVKS